MAAVLIIIVVAVIVCAAKLIPGLDPAGAEESGGGLMWRPRIGPGDMEAGHVRRGRKKRPAARGEWC